MSWQGVVTNQGAALLAAFGDGGHTLHIDGATVGSGITEAANMRVATALAHEEAAASVVRKELVPGGSKYKIQVGPSTTAAYTAHEIGLWAHLDNDATSILLALHQDADGGVGVPLASVSPNFAFALYIMHAISNDGAVVIHTDDTAFVTQGTLEEILEDYAKPEDVAGKADKVSNAIPGNFAGLDSNGNLTDSGSKASDFLTAHQDISGKLDASTLGIVENGNTAANNIAAGQYVVWNGALCVAISAIASGAALSSGNLAAVPNGGMNAIIYASAQPASPVMGTIWLKPKS